MARYVERLGGFVIRSKDLIRFVAAMYVLAYLTMVVGPGAGVAFVCCLILI